jgi:hypothetical protein
MITDYFSQLERPNIRNLQSDDVEGNQEVNRQQTNQVFQQSISLQYFSLTCQNMTKLVKLTNPEKP